MDTLTQVASDTINSLQRIAADPSSVLMDAPITQAPAPKGKGKGKGKAEKIDSGAPDYANMPTAELLAAYWGFVKNPLSDVASLCVNTVGGASADHVKGELSALVSVAIGLRKAYGRGVSASVVTKDITGIVIPAGFNPTFALYLSAARLRPDDASERKAAQEVRAAIRKQIRAVRKAD